VNARGTLAVVALAGATVCVSPTAARAATTCVPTSISSSSTPETLVKVRINGLGPYTFFVDTGATVSIVSSALARKLHLPPMAAVVHGVGAGGAFSTRAAKVAITVGDLSQDSVLVSVFDVSQIEAALGPVDGALGYNFLKMYRVTIDYPNRRLCLEEP
jgi:predicted aspartyl protease